MLIKINLLPKKKTVFKTINGISLVLLILNMSLGGVLVALNPANACHGYITIIKNTNGIESPNFEFTATGIEAPSAFSLSGGESIYFGRIQGGIYTITEANNLANWDLININCDNGSYSTTSDSVIINLANNDNVTCTFTNEYNPPQPTGSIKIIKNDASDSDKEFGFTTTNLTPTFFNLSDNGTNSASSTIFSNLSAGIYTIKEEAKINWRLTEISCLLNATGGTIESKTTTTIFDEPNGIGLSGGEVEIELDGNNQEIICTFTNVPIYNPPTGSIEICKYYDNGNIGTYETATDTPMEWPMIITHPGGATTTVNTSSSTGCVVVSDLELGDYVINEVPRVGGGWINSYPQNNQHNITLTSTTTNQQIHFLNYQYQEELGSITACKYIDDDGLASTTDDMNLATTTPWTFILNNGTTTSLIADNSGCAVFDNLSIGDYTVSEVEQDGWVALSATSTEVNIVSGDLDKIVAFVNYKEPPIIKGSIEICKYIDDDGLASTTNDRYLSTTTPWTFSLNDNFEIISQETTENGCTIFNNLNAGNYDISEIPKQYWQALSPLNGTTSTILQAGEDKTINFINYYTKPYCGDGVVNGNEECDGGSNCNSSCKRTGGGGGGGTTVALKISDEKIYCFSEDSVRITWRTNYYKESVIFYGEQSQKDAGIPPNYGYASSTKKTTEKATFHSVVVNDIKDDTYYFRPMSGNVKGKELSVDMTECRTEVKGEEGFPVLTIDKTINDEFINPGDKNIKYTILVSNTGNLDAFAVILTDSLPLGLTFASSSDIIKTWNLGDMEPGTNKTIIYLVDSDKEIKKGVYTNIAEVVASNHKKISDSADLEVREVKVLAATGFNINEFLVISSSAFLLFGATFSLKRIQL